MGQLRPLFHLFSSFQSHITILRQINVKNVHPVYGTRDSNSRPLEHESPPLPLDQGSCNGFPSPYWIVTILQLTLVCLRWACRSPARSLRTSPKLPSCRAQWTLCPSQSGDRCRRSRPEMEQATSTRLINEDTDLIHKWKYHCTAVANRIKHSKIVIYASTVIVLAILQSVRL